MTDIPALLLMSALLHAPSPQPTDCAGYGGGGYGGQQGGYGGGGYGGY
jgi:hypothetical protein